MEPGSKLGHYEITEQLGAGGMGEVYLAQDTRLGRKVAIKVLPAEFASDPERLARFEQEARAAAALNHPHIAVVHDIGTEGDTHFMVQEYLEGDTLREPLGKGALPLKKALGLATEIAEALAAAHAAGIIHRDLKPENIFVTKEGHAKVLDFGLAKLTEVAVTGSPDDFTHSPTAMGTAAGQMMGTAGYMAPEQVEGSPEIDHRADLFAFGCVLYEMVAGTRPFGGRNVAEVLHHLLNSEPEPVSDTLPLKLQWSLDKCLAKEPARRYQHADDVVVDLKALAGEVESSAPLPVSGEAPTTPVAVETARGIPWKPTASIAVASVLVGALGVWITTPSPPEPLITRFDIDYPPETTFDAASTLGVAISPDGSSVVFNANRQLWLRAIDDLVATLIRGTEDARVPFFSPDGQQLGFWSGSLSDADGQMKRVSITGGAPVLLGPAPGRPYGASWAEDGYIYFGQGAGGILRVSDNGGEPQVVVQMEEGEQAHGPQLLPGGEWLLFTLRSASGSWNDASIVAQPVSGGDREVLVAGGTDGRYVPTGHIVYSLERNLFAVPFDADNVEVTGGSVSIVEGVQQAGLTGAAQYAFSDRGGLVYMPDATSGGFQLVWVDRDGQVELPPFEPRSFFYLDLSPDGQHIALDILGDDGKWDIWIYEVERGGSGVLLTTEGNNDTPVWSPDGEWVFFASDRNGNFDIWKRRADWSLAAELVLDAEANVWPESISDDGEMLLFDSGLLGEPLDVGVLALDTGDAEMLVATAVNELSGSFSPDGRFFAFASNETGQMEVYVREVSSGRTFSVSTSTRGGASPRWSRDGREIYYVSSNSSGILVAEVDLESFSASDPVEVSDIVLRSEGNFDVTADGQKFLVTVPAGTDETGGTAPNPRLNVVLNWFEELNRLVPTGGS